MKDHFVMFAQYNRWSNQRIYDAAALLSVVDYRADRGAFFGSLENTLNHILVGDRIWMHRFTGSGPTYTDLATVPYGDLVSLRDQRGAEDKRIIAYVDGLSDDDLAKNFTYRTIINPADVSQPLSPALAHFFNHQTHHRGQAHTLLSGLGVDPPSLDLIAFQRETGLGLSS